MSKAVLMGTRNMDSLRRVPSVQSPDDLANGMRDVSPIGAADVYDGDAAQAVACPEQVSILLDRVLGDPCTYRVVCHGLRSPGSDSARFGAETASRYIATTPFSEDLTTLRTCCELRALSVESLMCLNVAVSAQEPEPFGVCLDFGTRGEATVTGPVLLSGSIQVVKVQGTQTTGIPTVPALTAEPRYESCF